MIGRMRMGWTGLCLILAACAAPGAIDAPAQADLSAELVRLSGEGPPDGPEGACWANDITPAVIETVTTQVMVTPEIRDETGQVTSPATFRTETQTRMIRDREEVWFRTPCDDQMTIDFIASLQRALKARGLYLAPLTGTLDAATSAAIRRYQADRGFDSPVLTLAAAQELGLLATAPDQL